MIVAPACFDLREYLLPEVSIPQYYVVVLVAEDRIVRGYGQLGHDSPLDKGRRGEELPASRLALEVDH